MARIEPNECREEYPAQGGEGRMGDERGERKRVPFRRAWTERVERRRRTVREEKEKSNEEEATTTEFVEVGAGLRTYRVSSRAWVSARSQVFFF